MNKERTARSLPGIATFVVLLTGAVLLIGLMIWFITQVLVPAGESVGIAELAGIILIVIAFIAVCVGFGGLTPVNPNEARAVVFFGHYAGTLRDAGAPLGQPVHRADAGSPCACATSRRPSSRSTTSTATRSRSRRSSSGR